MRSLATLVIAALVGCTKAPAAVDAGGLRSVEWGALRLHVPVDTQAGEVPGGFELTRRAGSRTPDTLSLSPASASEREALSGAATSTSGPFAYRVERHEGGSGGAEVVLVGVLVIDDTNWRVECRAQSELPEPSADWCLPYVLTIERR